MIVKLLFSFILFITISYSQDSKTDSAYYQYRIVGYDSTWKPASAMSKELWSHLNAGKYLFEVRARAGNQTDWQNISIVEIEVKPPFWETWIYRVVTLLIVIVALLLYRRYELRKKYISKQVIAERQKVIEMERSRIARDFHDGIGTSLSQVSISTDVAHKKMMEKDYGGAEEEVKFVSETIHNLMDTLRDIIWTLDPTHNKLEDLIVNIRFQAARSLQSKGIKLSFSSNLDVADIPLASEFRRHIFFIVKEALNNVCKHSAATNVEINVAMDREDFTLEIGDNGTGFCFDKNESDPRQGKGMKNMKHRAEVVGGMLDLYTEAKKGSRIQITVPTSKLSVGSY
jgi:signal transduction histidine kinase